MILTTKGSRSEIKLLHRFLILKTHFRCLKFLFFIKYAKYFDKKKDIILSCEGDVAASNKNLYHTKIILYPPKFSTGRGRIWC